MADTASKALFYLFILFLSSGLLLSTSGTSVSAQDAPSQEVLEDEDTGPSIDFPVAKLQSLDKITARTATFEAKVGSTIRYGTLYIKVQACRESKPLEKPESAAFLQIWEAPPGSDKSEWVFSGWMFASSPALSAMDHSVYDVWVLDCLEVQEDKSGEQNENPDIDQEELESAPEDESETDPE